MQPLVGNAFTPSAYANYRRYTKMTMSSMSFPMIRVESIHPLPIPITATSPAGQFAASKLMGELDSRMSSVIGARLLWDASSLALTH